MAEREVKHATLIDVLNMGEAAIREEYTRLQGEWLKDHASLDDCPGFEIRVTLNANFKANNGLD